MVRIPVGPRSVVVEVATAIVAIVVSLHGVPPCLPEHSLARSLVTEGAATPMDRADAGP
jgi:hypothetical protein